MTFSLNYLYVCMYVVYDVHACFACNMDDRYAYIHVMMETGAPLH